MRRRRSIDFDSLPEVENRELLALLATAATAADTPRTTSRASLRWYATVTFAVRCYR